MEGAAEYPAFGLYNGVVTHARHRPVRHALRYRIFMLLIDLDQAPALLAARRWLSSGRFGLVGFREADHGDGSDRPLQAQVRERLRAAGLPADGPIRLLTIPRVLGHAFNPISVYFCHRADGGLVATLYEVSNTFGERHGYLISVDDPDSALVRQTIDKQFYVSPFMDMNLSYRFRVQPPGETTRLVIDVDGNEGSMLTAAFVGRWSPLTDARLLAAWASHPLLTVKVVAGIHWEALKLFLKGMRLRSRPPPPEQAVTVARRSAGSPVHGDPARVA
ncbi:DUF1365 domain-containing protein [Caulobacter mirabilis]|uniref:DUF1365 domain-containing protein n=1 Tax=Caulobacter mirabilis TaxID=69666 RepID=A0A2D2AZE4_9CAUL|nr:DUF1365 domain-containing protein [Caulobacter mirabilis]ATQ43379.1 hypothetical protein CSW64_13645 [Caulobacter mirabilis]